MFCFYALICRLLVFYLKKQNATKLCELCWAAERKGSQKGQHTSNSINPIYCYLYTMDKNFSMFQYTE